MQKWMIRTVPVDLLEGSEGVCDNGPEDAEQSQQAANQYHQ